MYVYEIRGQRERTFTVISDGADETTFGRMVRVDIGLGSLIWEGDRDPICVGNIRRGCPI